MKPASTTQKVAKPGSGRHLSGTSPAPGANGGPSPPASPSSPGALAVKELLRALLIAEKNYQLYPTHGRVVQQSLQSLLEVLNTTFGKVGSPLEIQVGQHDLSFQGENVHHEEARSKGLANRLYTDTVRKVIIAEGVTIQELTQFLDSLKAARNAGDEGDDFSTIFWAKETTNFSIETADDFTTEEALAVLPVSIDTANNLAPERFQLSDAEERSLRDALAHRPRREDGGDPTFELTPEELARIQEMISAEENYFPLYDFIDLLPEHMARSRDVKGFQTSVKTVEAILGKMISGFDFEHAMGLMARLSEPKSAALDDQQKAAVRAVSQGLCNKLTFEALSSFLKESAHLPRQHGVFGFMKSLGEEAIPHICGLLAHAEHTAAISDVLVSLAAGKDDALCQFLLDADAQVARSVVQVILRVDLARGVERVAPALRHPDENVRIHAAKTLLEHGDARAAPLLVQLLKSESRPLLHSAIQFFAKVPSPAAFTELKKLTESRRIHELDSQKLDQCFKAFMLSNPKSAFESLIKTTLRWRLTLGEQSAKKKAAALRSLALCPLEPVRDLLAKFARSRYGSLGGVARRVLDVIEHNSSRGQEPQKDARKVELLQEELHA